MGFDYFYGFVGGDANQWQPNLFRNTTAIYPYVGHPGWNLITAEADDSITYLHRITAINSDQAHLQASPAVCAAVSEITYRTALSLAWRYRVRCTIRSAG